MSCPECNGTGLIGADAKAECSNCGGTGQVRSEASMRVVVYRKRLLWRVKLVGANGETVMVSETYYSRSNAVRAAQRLRKLL